MAMNATHDLIALACQDDSAKIFSTKFPIGSRLSNRSMCDGMQNNDILVGDASGHITRADWSFHHAVHHPGGRRCRDLVQSASRRRLLRDSCGHVQIWSPDTATVREDCSVDHCLSAVGFHPNSLTSAFHERARMHTHDVVWLVIGSNNVVFSPP
jgi:hypothetical protein